MYMYFISKYCVNGIFQDVTSIDVYIKQRILLYFAIRPPHSLIVIICGLYMYMMYQKLCFAQLV